MTVKCVDGSYIILSIDHDNIGIKIGDSKVYYLDEKAALWLSRHLLEMVTSPDHYIPVIIDYDVG